MSHKASHLARWYLFTALIFANSSNAKQLEEVTVIANQLVKDTTIVSPTSMIDAKQLESINFTTVEDALAHEPSLIVRKRFIGDPNGVIGIRGSNMFQTTRSMVFVDGMPLHYHLQTRFRGSPRWSLVSPGEIENVEVIYGPYSSEYSGNAMGGVVNIHTRRPRSERITLEAGYFAQQYDQLNTDETYDGYRTFASYENRFGNFGMFVSYTRLENESQPQTQFFDVGTAGSGGTAVTGAITGVNEFGEQGIYFGDSGPEQAATDLLKAKFFYNLDTVELRASIAYEDRSRVEDQRNNFLRDASNNAVFDSTVNVGGVDYSTASFGRSVFQNRDQDRESLLLGLGASFEISNDWIGDVFYSYFSVIDDIEVRTGRNPLANDFASTGFRGRITEYDDTGWQIFDAKFATESLLDNDNQRLAVGVHYDSYELNFIVDDYDSILRQRDSDEVDGDPGTGRADSGGKANTFAVFAQYGYRLGDHWDLSLGLRYDDWQTSDGFEGGNISPDRSENGFSPKISLAWLPNESQEIRYSIARALRFPVIEELYVNDTDTSSSGLASDPNLDPEDGIFHNLSFSQQINNGSIDIHLFYETVNDVIFNQTTNVSAGGSLTTFLPVGEVTTKGVEFIVNQQSVLNLALDMRFNITYTDAEITDNVFNRALENNEFPRTPNWRSNLLLNYHLAKRWDLGGSVRYASDSFGELDNSDNIDNVFGAQDSFIFFGTKLNWQTTDQLKLSVGVDNLFNEEAYVFHPWPGRTYHLQAKYQIGE